MQKNADNMENGRIIVRFLIVLCILVNISEEHTAKAFKKAFDNIG